MKCKPVWRNNVNPGKRNLPLKSSGELQKCLHLIRWPPESPSQARPSPAPCKVVLHYLLFKRTRPQWQQFPESVAQPCRLQARVELQANSILLIMCPSSNCISQCKIYSQWSHIKIVYLFPVCKILQTKITSASVPVHNTKQKQHKKDTICQISYLFLRVSKVQNVRLPLRAVSRV